MSERMGKVQMSTLHAPSIGQRLQRDREDVDKGADAYSTTQCDIDSSDNTQPPTVVPQDMAAEPVKSGPEGPALPDVQLDTDGNGNLQCPEAEPLCDPTETVNTVPESPASASGEMQEDLLRPKREMATTCLNFTYSQMGVRLHPEEPSFQTPVVIPDQALASWLLATSGPCFRQYPTAMSPLQFQYQVPQPVWVPWWASNESASRQTCATSH